VDILGGWTKWQAQEPQYCPGSGAILHFHLPCLQNTDKAMENVAAETEYLSE